MGGKTRNIAIQLVLQQCCKTSCTFLSPVLPYFRRIHVQPTLVLQILELQSRCSFEPRVVEHRASFFFRPGGRGKGELRRVNTSSVREGGRRRETFPPSSRAYRIIILHFLSASNPCHANYTLCITIIQCCIVLPGVNKRRVFFYLAGCL